MGQQEIQKYLMKQKEDIYVSAAKLRHNVGNIDGLSSMINYGEVEMVKIKIEGTHIIQYCYKLIRKSDSK